MKRLVLTPRERIGKLESADPNAPKPKSNGAINLDNVLKMIPGDVVSLFIAGSGLSALAQQQGAVAPENWPLINFSVCFVVCLLLRIATTRAEGESGFSIKGANWSLVWVTLFAFFIWAHAVSPTGPIIASFHGAFAGFFAMALGALAPVFVRAE